MALDGLREVPFAVLHHAELVHSRGEQGARFTSLA